MPASYRAYKSYTTSNRHRQRTSWGEPFFPYRRFFYGNDCEGADEVIAYLNGQVQQRTDGSYGVEIASKSLFQEQSKGGRLTLAYVPRGKSAKSPEARLFELSEYGVGMRFAARASDEVIAVRQAAGW